MNEKITIDNITRIEGHAKISIFLNDSGDVSDARLHATQFRGFEKFIEGRPYDEMPVLTARICGICPISHSIAAAKACDQILSVRIPDTAIQLRRIINLAQIIQSHAVNFFYLSSPDFLMSMDAEPLQRNIFGVMQDYPEIARDGIKLRQFGQQIIEWMAGKRIHPSWIVPGGVNAPLKEEIRDQILSIIPDAQKAIQRTIDWYKAGMGKYQEYIRLFGNFPSHFLGLVGKDGNLEHYNGKIRVVSPRGTIEADDLDPYDYQTYIAEAIENWSYLKFPYYRPYGYPDGIYRVGPLARLNIANQCGTPLADQELAEFHCLDLGAVLSSFHYHYARLIEILYAIEMIDILLKSSSILDHNVCSYAGVNRLEGIGVSEAPRGTLIHHYQVDENGLIKRANLIIASGHNNLAMNKGLLQVARHYVHGKNITESTINRIQAVIRAFDPCLSCATHATNQLSLQIHLFSHDGELLQEIKQC